MRSTQPFTRVSLVAGAIAFAVALPFNAAASEPTPDPAEPYAIGAPDLSVPFATSSAEATLS